MDQIKSTLSSSTSEGRQQQGGQQPADGDQKQGGILGSITDKLGSATGGEKESEVSEDKGLCQLLEYPMNIKD